VIKRVVLPLLLVLLVSITIGCIRIVGPSEPSMTEKPIEGGQFTTYDLDKDGQDDRYVYKFATEEVANDVFLDRTLEYDKNDDGYQGKIILQFDDRSNGKTDYVHIEEIPKEFAAHVDELEFSVPPDEIIDPDVEVKWLIEVTADAMIQITKQIPESSPEQLVEQIASTTIMYNLDNPEFIEKGPDTDKRILQRASEFKGMLPHLARGAGESPTWLGLCGRCSQPYAQMACVAILSGNPQEWCMGSRLDKESDKDMCKGIYIEHECQDIADKAAREKCYFTKAVELNCAAACRQLTDSDSKNLCLAGVYNDARYCEEIKDPKTKNKCLEALGTAPKTIFLKSDLDNIVPDLEPAGDIKKRLWSENEMKTLHKDEDLSVVGRMETWGDWKLNGEEVSISIYVTAFQTQEMADKYYKMQTEYFDEELKDYEEIARSHESRMPEKITVAEIGGNEFHYYLYGTGTNNFRALHVYKYVYWDILFNYSPSSTGSESNMKTEVYNIDAKIRQAVIRAIERSTQ
jgi:hypothetical protein